MSKTTDPVEVVRDKVVPAAEELVAAAAERISPLAKEAVERVSPVAHAAAEKTAALVHAAAEKVGPVAEQARDTVAPYAQQAADAVGPYTERVAPLAHQAAEAVAPYAALVKEQGRKTGLDLAERLEPAYGAAVDAFNDTKGKVTERAGDVIPAVGAAATSAAATAAPFVSAAADRGRSLVKNVRSEAPVPVVPDPPKKRGWLTTLAVVAAAAGATYVVVRRLTADKGSQWQTARPSTPYAPPTAAATTSASTTTASTTPTTAEPSTASLYGTGQEPQGSATGTDEDATAVSDVVGSTDRVADADEATPPVPGTPEHTGGSDGSTGSGDEGTAFRSVGGPSDDGEPTSPYGQDKVETELETAQERTYEEPEDAVLAEQDQAAGVGPDAHPDRYLDIPGVYLGIEPPEGYTIKGNERSMKYHLPDSNSYARTIAEVWFLDEEAAQKAGFTRAQH
ncbi:hypothetical protein SAMN04488544_2545 [Microlunatus sagamiharensis]|uniref:Uncharacterized protein n=1 Tax=Microlunatus sagamiharensis TaxID=546874 RepID=A0A1H2MQX0_9ACTN|nr:hypothetical protein [Microlunatus sagamiharensis]SDU95609.1 hypothetical protein SAMN04488544_2545 [Microlunatus sagamiharensis]